MAKVYALHISGEERSFTGKKRIKKNKILVQFKNE